MESNKISFNSGIQGNLAPTHDVNTETKSEVTTTYDKKHITLESSSSTELFAKITNIAAENIHVSITNGSDQNHEKGDINANAIMKPSVAHTSHATSEKFLEVKEKKLPEKPTTLQEHTLDSSSLMDFAAFSMRSTGMYMPKELTLPEEPKELPSSKLQDKDLNQEVKVESKSYENKNPGESLKTLSKLCDQFGSNKRITLNDQGELVIKNKGLQGATRKTVSPKAQSKLSDLLTDLKNVDWKGNKKLEKFVEKLEKHLTKADTIKHLEEKSGVKGNEHLKKEVRTVINLAKKNLKNEEAQEFTLNTLKDHKLVVIKDKDGKIDVLIKGKLLGMGGQAEVFRGYSSRQKEEVAFKQGKIGEGESKGSSKGPEEEMKHESQILGLLGQHEGIQESVKFSKFTDSSGQVTGVTVGKLYSQGDLSRYVAIEGLGKYFDTSSEGLLKMDANKFDNLINDKIKLSENPQRNQKIASNPKFTNQNAKDFINEELGDPSVLINLFGIPFSNKYDELTQTLVNIKRNNKNDYAQLNNKCNEAMNKYLTETRSMVKEMVQDYKAAIENNKFKHMETKDRFNTGAKLLSGLMYMHSKEIVHGDIKPQNVFGDRMADFGAAKMKKDLIKDSGTGTPGYDLYRTFSDRYADPEQKFRVVQADDMRAMGLTLYQMITGGQTPDRRDFKISEKYAHMLGDLENKGLPKEIADIVVKLCKPIPSLENALNQTSLKVKDEKSGLNIRTSNGPELPPEFPLPATEEEMTTLMNWLRENGN